MIWELRFMHKFKTSEQAYKSCQSDGFFVKLLYVNKQRIKSLAKNMDTNINSANKLAGSLSNEDEGWMNVYTMYYEAIRICAEALMMFDKVMSKNHECLFAYLCAKKPELNLDWNFFEKIRRKRNGVNYYGEQVSYDEWKGAEPQFNRYASALKKAIEKKLNV